MKTGQASRISGVFWMAIGGVALIGYAVDADSHDLGTWMFALALFVIGLVLWARGRRLHRIFWSAFVFEKRLAAEPDCTVQSLADGMGRTPAQVRESLVFLHRNRALENAYTDKSRACIVFRGNPRLLVSLDPGRQAELDAEALDTAREEPLAQAGTRTEPAAELVTVSCPGCGAANRLRPGKAGACEYCGTAIETAERGEE